VENNYIITFSWQGDSLQRGEDGPWFWPGRTRSFTIAGGLDCDRPTHCGDEDFLIRLFPVPGGGMVLVIESTLDHRKLSAQVACGPTFSAQTREAEMLVNGSGALLAREAAANAELKPSPAAAKTPEEESAWKAEWQKKLDAVRTATMDRMIADLRAAGQDPEQLRVRLDACRVCPLCIPVGSRWAPGCTQCVVCADRWSETLQKIIGGHCNQFSARDS
jgi:hypothetical protein